MFGLIDMDIELNGVTATEITPLYEKPDRAIIYYHGLGSSRMQSLYQGRILAAMGHLVILYEQPGHGLREREIELHPDTPDLNFWEALIQTATESPNVIRYLVEQRGIHANRIAFAGHSMGAMAAAAIFVKTPVGKLICYNGCLRFRALAEAAAARGLVSDAQTQEILSKIRYYDPGEYLQKLENRPILLVDGQDDAVLPPETNREIADLIRPFYKDKSLLSHIVIGDAGHALTVLALEKTGLFLDRKGVQSYGI